MIYLKKASESPKSLAIEKEKANGSYSCKDVLKMLVLDFKHKCYICETKDATTLNVEHFKPHKGDKHLKFDWDNLFLACGHCNNIKLAKYENLLNCTKEEDRVDDRIKCIYKPFYPLEIEPLDNDPKTLETTELLQNVYNGTTDLKKIEADHIRKNIIKEMNILLDLIKELWESSDESTIEFLKIKIKTSLSRGYSYTAIKRWYVKESPYLKEFIAYFD